MIGDAGNNGVIALALEPPSSARIQWRFAHVQICAGRTISKLAVDEADRKKPF